MTEEERSISKYLFGGEYDSVRSEGKEEGYQNGFEDGVKEGYRIAKHEFENEIVGLKNRIIELEEKEKTI